MNRIAKLTFMLSLALTQPLVQAHSDPELEVHGALAMGYIKSSGNNYLSSSTQGTNNVYEVAINARTSLTPELLVAGQLMARDYGTSDDGRMRLDYLQLDYQFWRALSGSAGLRLGKLKNPVGFYNDSRDIVFSRPGILLPSVYLEDTGIRDLLFASEGVQGYSHWELGPSLSHLVVGWGRERDATDEFERAAGMDIGGDVEIDDLLTAQWIGEWAGGSLRTGISYFGGNLRLRPEDASVLPATRLEADLWVLSLQRLWSNGSLTAEYRLTEATTVTAGSRSQSKSDSAYVQYRRQFGQQWSGYLRYDLNALDRNDRRGYRAEASTGAPRYTRFSRSHVAGFQWAPTSNWGVFGEFHYVDGTANVRAQDNVGRDVQRYWTMGLVMIAYQF